jgi:P-type E1-E2 ATPase
MLMQASKANVMRDGKLQEIDATELVPGDLVKVQGGDCVPADLRVTKIISVALQVSQASLTGESVNVSKNTNALADAPML